MFKRSRTQRSYVNGDDEISVVKIQRPEFPLSSRADTIASSRSSCSDVDPSDYDVHESCVIQNFPKHKSSHLRFLAWVAYTRKYTDESITEDERRTCPLLWCRSQFNDQEAMLEHVYNCPYLSKGLYWCFHCQKPERVGNFKCRRCQGAPSRTDRISSVAKKIFSKLGARPHRSDHVDFFKNGEDVSRVEYDIFEESSCSKGQSNFDGQWDYQQAHELPNDEIVREMPADFSAAAHELGDNYISEMVGTECAVELGVGNENWADNFYIDEWESSAPTVQAESTKPPRLSLDTSCSPLSLHSSQVKLAQNICASTWDEPPLSATLISPMSVSGGFGYSPLEISPTDSDTSGNTFSTFDSGYSSATSYIAPFAWNFSTTGLESFGSMNDKKGKKRQIGQISDDWVSGSSLSPPLSLPSIQSVCMAQDASVSRSNSSSTTHSASRCPISERPKPISPHWRNASDLVQSFSEVLDAHMEHTKSALKELPSTSITQELLAMSRTSMVSLGLDVLQGILEGRSPTAIIQAFAFMHIAFALAIAVDQDEAKVETRAWFDDSLKWVYELPSERQQQVYLQIARAVWQPMDASGMTDQTDQNTASDSPRLLFESCKHFLDVFESLGNNHESIDTSNSGFSYIQASFELKAKTQVINELIQEVGVEAFIEDVVSVERRLMQGQITSVRSLELDLIFVGKLASQSETIYTRFVNHVTRLCNALYSENGSISRTTHHIQDIAAIKRLLPEENFHHNACYSSTQEIRDQGLFDEDIFLKLDLDLENDDDVSTTAITRDLDDILGQASTSRYHGSFNISRTTSAPPEITTPKQGLLSPFTIPPSHHHVSITTTTPQPMAPLLTPISKSPIPHPVKSTTASPFQPVSTLSCHCGYIPTGEEKWKASNLRRHKRTQHPSHEKRKTYRCKIEGCKSVFTRSDNLRSHARDKHGVDEGRIRSEGGDRGEGGEMDIEE